MMILIWINHMQLASAALVPFQWMRSFFVKYACGRYSLPVSFVAAFFMFTLSSLYLDSFEYCMHLTNAPIEIIKAAKALVLAMVVIYLQVGLWLSSSTTYWFFRICLRLMIVNNSVVLLVFLMISLGMLHVDNKPLMNNPNVPVRIR